MILFWKLFHSNFFIIITHSSIQCNLISFRKINTGIFNLINCYRKHKCAVCIMLLPIVTQTWFDVLVWLIDVKTSHIQFTVLLIQLAIGPVPSPFDCYLANRGLKTLHLRMRQHQVNAMAVAKFLEQNPRVEKVVYPGTVFNRVGGRGLCCHLQGHFCK